MVARTKPEVRLAELLAVMALGTDLGLGQPMEHVLRQCMIALRLADGLRLDEEERAVVYYTALLAWVGCHVDAHEQSRWFGDELAMKADVPLVDFKGPRSEIAFLVGHLGAGRPPLERVRLGLAFLTGDGRSVVDAMFENHTRATNALTIALGFDERIRESLGQVFERWDGRGLYGRRGDDICVAARIVTLADVVEVFHRIGGIQHALAAARSRTRTQFDPALVALLADEAPRVLTDLDTETTWDTVIAAEPPLQRRLLDHELDPALRAVARSCEFPHFLYVISGQMRVLMDDGSEVELRAGDVASIPPGHDAEVVGEEPCVTVDIGEGDTEYGLPQQT